MLNKILKAPIKTKLLLSVLGISLLCICITLTISYSSSKNSLTSMGFNQLEAMRGISTKRVTDHLENSKTFTKLLSNDRLTEGLFLAYESAFFAAGFSIGKDQQLKTDSFKKLDEIYGEKTAELVKSYSLANFLLVNINGQILYSAKAFENSYFSGRSLSGGALKSSKLAQCVNSAKTSNSKKIFFSDYEYLPDFKKTMAFFCVNTFAEFPHLSEGINKGDMLGVLVGQLDTDLMTSFLSAREGMGETGQTYLIGSDGLLRSDFFINKEKFNINNSHQKNLKIQDAVFDEVIKNKKAVTTTMKDPNGSETLTAIAPLEFEGKTWALVSEKQTDEIYAPVRDLLKKVFIYSFLVLLFVGFLGLYFSNILMAPIILASETLADVCKSLNTDSNHLSQSASVLNNSAKDQSDNLQMTVQAVQEITSTIEQNTNNARNSEDLAKQSLQTAQKGKIVIERMINSMNDINEGNKEILNQVDNSNKRINEILTMISEIESKTKMINDIVFQTKLLSFNASVEAARAGENGKGFAVVAEEVGKLAESSGASAKEISDLLTESVAKVESIIKETTQKIDAVSKMGVEKVKSGQDTAEECSEVFGEIVNSFNRVSSMVSEISLASNEQSLGMTEINKAMDRLNAGTDKSTQIASESNEAASKLETRAKTLEEVVQNIQQVIHGV